MYYNVVHLYASNVKELLIDTLIIEEDRPVHIAKHFVTIDEVIEVLTGDYAYIAGRENRWLVIGKTAREVFLTIGKGRSAAVLRSLVLDTLHRTWYGRST